MSIYLLHMNEPLPRGQSRDGQPLIAGHYIGYADDLLDRMIKHLSGKGANFTKVCCQRNVTWVVARTWEGEQATRTFERQLKRQKNAPRLCPICNPDAANHKNLEEQ